MREKIFRSDEIRSFIDHLNIVKEKSKSLFSVESKVTLPRLPRSIFGSFLIYGWFQSFFWSKPSGWKCQKIKGESKFQRISPEFDIKTVV